MHNASSSHSDRKSSFKVQAWTYVLQKITRPCLRTVTREKAMGCEAPWAMTLWRGQLWSLLLQSACFRGRKVFALYMLAVIFITCCCQAPLSFVHRQHKWHRSGCVFYSFLLLLLLLLFPFVPSSHFIPRLMEMELEAPFAVPVDMFRVGVGEVGVW